MDEVKITTGVLFTAAEIAEASGIPKKTIQARIASLKKAGEIPKTMKGAYNYEDVKKILRPRPVRNGVPRPSAVALLKSKLNNDGFRVAKGEAK